MNITIKQYEQAADEKVSIGGIKWRQKWDVCIQCDSREEAESIKTQFNRDWGKDAYGYAKRLAEAIYQKHYRQDSPEWKPLDDTLGVLTQIDNMTSGLVNPLPKQEPVVWMYQDKSTNKVHFQKHMRDFVDHGQTYEIPLYAAGWVKEFQDEMSAEYNPTENNTDYKRGFIDGMQKQMQSSVDKAVNRMTQPEPSVEPVAFKIYKQTSPRLGIPDVKIDALPWVYDQDPSSGFVASMWVVPANSAPLQREWQGLTEQEHANIAVEAGCASADWVFYGAAVERALKEKNT